MSLAKVPYRRLCIILLSCVLLAFVLTAYGNWKEEKERASYVNQMERIYTMMEDNSQKAQQIALSNGVQGVAISQQGKGVVADKSNSFANYKSSEMIDKLQKKTEQCRQLLIQLPKPPQSMASAYSALLDAHISYKQYVKLILTSSNSSDSFIKEEEKLKGDLKKRLGKLKQMIKQV
ncbi:hypothetical protein [Bacillus xiapuensis]|uniref:hypothetical protein n=1 Tax=Bacillus xiapuensis TaxID=2014075 RepID=UPI000C2500E0|nr:hypothetical protein [Bacillus xiapuensis]